MYFLYVNIKLKPQQKKKKKIRPYVFNPLTLVKHARISSLWFAFFLLLLDFYIYQLLYRTYVELSTYICIYSPSTPFIHLEYSGAYNLLHNFSHKGSMFSVGFIKKQLRIHLCIITFTLILAPSILKRKSK